MKINIKSAGVAVAAPATSVETENARLAMLANLYGAELDLSIPLAFHNEPLAWDANGRKVLLTYLKETPKNGHLVLVCPRGYGEKILTRMRVAFSRVRAVLRRSGKKVADVKITNIGIRQHGDHDILVLGKYFDGVGGLSPAERETLDSIDWDALGQGEK